MLKQRPCAYCGSKAVERERGHVIPNCLYPPALDPKIQRITVPECVRCKVIWQDAETQFRNIMAIAGDPNDYVHQLWDGPVTRSFRQPSGRRWAADLVEQMVGIETEDGPRHKVYPAKDDRVMLVVRKIIRGLCHKEHVATAVADERVWAGVMIYTIPEEYQKKMTWKSLDDRFFRYGYVILNDSGNDIHSVWALTFFELRKFIGVVSLSESGWKQHRLKCV